MLSQHAVKDKIILAMDTDDDTLSWIQKGVIVATISQTPHHELVTKIQTTLTITS